MTQTDRTLPQLRSLGETSREDAWWTQPLIVFLGLFAFVVYSAWAALQGEFYWYSGAATAAAGEWEAQYLSPFYSPVLFSDPEVAGHAPVEHAWFGAWPDWLPRRLLGFIPITPAILILWGPGLFRLTCYYYRGAYYKAFWADPLNCSVGEPTFRGKDYRGENWFPLIIQNTHRYFLYVVFVFLVILSYDAVVSFIYVARDPVSGEVVDHAFGVGVGSLVLVLNVVLLAGYTFGCHSLRHLIGGGKDRISANAIQFQAYRCVSCFNRQHMLWAWMSLIWVGFADLYIRLCSAGVWRDLHVVIG